MLLAPARAFAYYDRGVVGVSVGSSNVSVQAGGSTSVSVSLLPASDQQTQGCGMAECPQKCPGECLDGNGQCTCAGLSYSTYYPSVSVTSSNGGVAQASYFGGAVQIYGSAAGSATITVTASLRQFSSSSTTINVQVSEAAAGGGASGGAAGGGSTGGSTGSSNTGGGTGSSTSATSNGVVASPTELALAALEQGTAEQDTVIEMHGRTLRLAALTPSTDVLAMLKNIAGTTEQLTLWRGGTVDKPDYSWVFQGQQIDPDSLATLDNLDLEINVSAKGSGLVASLLDGANKSLVLDFAHDGALPAPATIYVAAPAGITPDDDLGLYLYSEQGGGFNKVLGGLWSENGYIAFEIDHCSTWAISAENLAALGSAQSQSGQPYSGFSTEMIVAIVVVAVVLVAALATALLVVKSRKNKKTDASS
jgi:hypothetical protein